jgi:hypothetical protein
VLETASDMVAGVTTTSLEFAKEGMKGVKTTMSLEFETSVLNRTSSKESRMGNSVML